MSLCNTYIDAYLGPKKGEDGGGGGEKIKKASAKKEDRPHQQEQQRQQMPLRSPQAAERIIRIGGEGPVPACG